VSALPAQTYPGLTVSWSGTDAGSGVAEFDVYYTQNGGPITPWLIGTELTSANFFQAVPGSTYAFYSIATDAVGYREDISVIPDASTTILPSANIAAVITTKGSVAVTFTESLPTQSLIDNYTIASLFSIRDKSDVLVSLTNPQFTYDAVAKKLNVTWTNALPAGDYSFAIGTSGFTDAAGSKLSLGWSGASIKVRDNTVGSNVKANGTDIILADAHPSLVDFDGDGLSDLMVGKRITTDQSKVRVHRNSGTAANPVFTSHAYLQSINGDLVVEDDGSKFRMHDWNGDGELDLTVGRSDGRVEVWINVNTTADPIFGVPRFASVTGASTTEIDVGGLATPEWIDWNNDGRKDLLVSSSDGQIHLYVDQSTRGTPRFTSSSLVMLGVMPIATPNAARVAAGDLNGDGRFDLVVGAGGKVVFYPNVGAIGSPRFVAG